MADMVPQGVQREGKLGGYEHGDANIRAVVMTMSVILGTVAIVMLVVGGMIYALNKREQSHDVALSAVYERPIPPEPRLLPSRASGDGDPYDKYPWELGQQEREAQAKAATTPYWINKSRGQVSIPRDEALEMVANQGLPARQPRGTNQPSIGDDLAGSQGAGSQDVADADLDGTMVPDTTGGRAMSDSLVQAPSLGEDTSSQGSTIAASAETAGLEKETASTEALPSLGAASIGAASGNTAPGQEVTGTTVAKPAAKNAAAAKAASGKITSAP